MTARAGRGKRAGGVEKDPKRRAAPKILVVDVGGTNVKVYAPGRDEPLKTPSGPTMTARRMVSSVRRLTAELVYNRVSIGYPGPVGGDSGNEM